MLRYRAGGVKDLVDNEGFSVRLGRVAEFYALARTALPDAIAEIQRLRALLTEACDIVDDCVRRHSGDPTSSSVTANRIRAEAAKGTP